MEADGVALMEVGLEQCYRIEMGDVESDHQCQSAASNIHCVLEVYLYFRFGWRFA